MMRGLDLSSLLFKMEIIFLLYEKREMFYTELWESLKEIIGSKATFNKYLRDLEKKNAVYVSYRRVGRGVRAYYSLTDPLRKKIDELMDCITEAVDNPELLHSLVLHHISSLTNNGVPKIFEKDRSYSTFYQIVLFTYIITRARLLISEKIPIEYYSKKMMNLIESLNSLVKMLT